MVRLVADLTGLTQTVATHLLAPHPLSRSQPSTARTAQRNTTQMRVETSKEELPFPFNPTDFLPTKDPLAAEVVAEALRFNRRLREARECEGAAGGGQVLALNRESADLRRVLLRLHLIGGAGSGGNGGSGKSGSHKALSASNLLLQQVLRLPPSLLTPKLLAMLRCRAARKLRLPLPQLGLLWRLCTPLALE